MAEIVIRQKILFKIALLAFLLSALVLGAVITLNWLSARSEKELIHLETFRIETNISSYSETLSDMGVERERLKSTLSRRENKSLEAQLTQLKDEIEKTVAWRQQAQELKLLNEGLLKHFNDSPEQLPLELERLALILDRPETKNSLGQSYDSLHFLFLRESKEEMTLRRTLYEAIETFNQTALPSEQQSIVQRRGWNGAKTLAQLFHMPLSFLFIAFTTIIPGIWLAKLFESGVIKTLLLSRSRKQLCWQLLTTIYLLWLFSLLVLVLAFFILPWLVNGFGSFRQLTLRGQVLRSFGESLCQSVPGLSLFSLQLTTLFTLIGVCAGAATVPPLLTIMTVISYSASSYIGMGVSPYNGLAFFDLPQEQLVFNKMPLLWFGLTTSLFLWLLARRILRFQLSD